MEEVISDLRAVAKGEPPLQAREKYDHDLLHSLATKGTAIEEDEDQHSEGGKAGAISAQWVLALGVLLVLSMLFNLVQLVSTH